MSAWGGAVSTLHAAIHIAGELFARILAGKLQAAIKSWFPRHIQHRGVLSDFGTGVAAERVGLAAPEE
jgi:hypothetical protein